MRDIHQAPERGEEYVHERATGADREVTELEEHRVQEGHTPSARKGARSTSMNAQRWADREVTELEEHRVQEGHR